MKEPIKMKIKDRVERRAHDEKCSRLTVTIYLVVGMKMGTGIGNGIGTGTGNGCAYIGIGVGRYIGTEKSQ